MIEFPSTFFRLNVFIFIIKIIFNTHCLFQFLEFTIFVVINHNATQLDMVEFIFHRQFWSIAQHDAHWSTRWRLLQFVEITWPGAQFDSHVAYFLTIASQFDRCRAHGLSIIINSRVVDDDVIRMESRFWKALKIFVNVLVDIRLQSISRRVIFIIVNKGRTLRIKTSFPRESSPFRTWIQVCWGEKCVELWVLNSWKPHSGSLRKIWR